MPPPDPAPSHADAPPPRHRPTTARVDALREALRTRFGPAIVAPLDRAATAFDATDRADPSVIAADPRALPSGWTLVDRALDGGLAPGKTALIEASPGGGSLALAASWAETASRRGEATLVLDGAGSALPHAWLEPEDARAPIWVLCPQPVEVWSALDIALRSGAFGLLIVLEPPVAPSGVGRRLVRLAADHRARIVLTRWPGRAPPWTPDHRVRLAAGNVRWVDGPTGACPATRTIDVSCGDGRGAPPSPRGAEILETAADDRLRARGRAPDRRPPSGRGGRQRR